MSENDVVVVCSLPNYIVAMIRMHDEADRDGFVYAIHDLFRILTTSFQSYSGRNYSLLPN